MVVAFHIVHEEDDAFGFRDLHEGALKHGTFYVLASMRNLLRDWFIEGQVADLGGGAKFRNQGAIEILARGRGVNCKSVLEDARGNIFCGKFVVREVEREIINTVAVL